MQGEEIKLVAFDMDGTFLNSQNDYDRKRFARIFPALRERGIEVVAISGNQYAQIRSFFPDYEEEMTIVSEVGSKIYQKGKRLAEWHFEREVVEDIVDMLADKGLLARCAVGGLDQIYMEKSSPAAFKDLIRKHNDSWKEIDSLLDLPEDDFCIVTLDVPDQDIAALVAELNQKGGEKARAVSSGFHFIDVILPTVNKGTALAYLGQRWGIAPSQMMAFGDSGNDVDMLAYVAHSYAMEGSPIEVQAVARHLAPSSDASGVLEILEQLVQMQTRRKG